MRRSASLIALAAALIAADAPPIVRGIDHMPVAVRDLDAATGHFIRLGFVMKPGRPHHDGIRNTHANFANGGGIELITAADATSDLARSYVDWLRHGDGPAWLALYAPAPIPDFPPPSRFFFGDRAPSPTDGPRWFAHPNTADRLTGAWLAGGMADYARLRTMGAHAVAVPGCTPFPRRGHALVLPDGEVLVFLPATLRPVDRALLGVTVHVRDLATARLLIAKAGVAVVTPPDCTDRAFWVLTHGLWLQFAA